MKFLVSIFVSLVAWGVAWLDAAVTWVIFDRLFGLFTLTWVLLFILAAAQQGYLAESLRKELK